MSQLAWIGLGNMGRGMCTNLVTKGNLAHPLILYNRTQRRASDLSSKLPPGKSVVASTIADAVSKADIVFTCVGDDAAVNESIDAALAVEGGVKGKLFVDCSTVHPDTTTALAKRITEAGAGFVAGPVFGAPAMADAGQLVWVLAGAPDLVEKVKPFTTGVTGRAIIDLSGEEHKKATHMKVVGNAFIFALIEATAQGQVLAERSGLGVEPLQKFLDALFPGPAPAYSRRMSTGDYHKREEPLFAVDLAKKDARHALKLAKDSGSQMSIVEIADRHLTQVKEHMGAKGDIAGIYGAIRKESGLPFEN